MRGEDHIVKALQLLQLRKSERDRRTVMIIPAALLLEHIERVVESGTGEVPSALLDEYGRVQDRFEGLGGYELESNARQMIASAGLTVGTVTYREDSAPAGQVMTSFEGVTTTSAPRPPTGCLASWGTSLSSE